MDSTLNFFQNQHLKRLLPCLLFVFILTKLHAQILYTDINDTILTFPEQVPGILDDSTNFYYFDLDQDGVDDFFFVAHYWEEWYSPSANEHPHHVMQLQSILNNGIAWENNDGCAIDFAYDDTIKSEVWESFGTLVVNVVGFCTSCNLPFQDRYFGLRMSQGTDHYYGWIRLDAATDTLLFKDFAINTVANEPIIAGHTSSAGIEDGHDEEARVYFDGRSLHFDENTFDKYIIYTIDGKVVRKENTPANGILDLTGLPGGFFIITLSGKGAVISRKISKR